MTNKSNNNVNIDWTDIIKKEARGINGADLGEVQNVESGHVIVKRGRIHKEQFYIPQDKVMDYDGSIVTFSISEDEMKSNYTEMASSSDSIDITSTSLSSHQREGQTTQEETTDETIIPLNEEKINVSKNTREEQISISKKPVTTIETIEVPITHEEISIEKMPASDQTQTPVTSEESIKIPIKREEVEVTKTPYVKEEVVVKKKPVIENRHVTEEVTSEEVKTSEIE